MREMSLTRCINDTSRLGVMPAHTGFGTHPHQEMEIITIVLDGELTHEDSLGTRAVMRADDVQRYVRGQGDPALREKSGQSAPINQVWNLSTSIRGSTAPSYDRRASRGQEQPLTPSGGLHPDSVQRCPSRQSGRA